MERASTQASPFLRETLRSGKPSESLFNKTLGSGKKSRRHFGGSFKDNPTKESNRKDGSTSKDGNAIERNTQGSLGKRLKFTGVEAVKQAQRHLEEHFQGTSSRLTSKGNSRASSSVRPSCQPEDQITTPTERKNIIPLYKKPSTASVEVKKSPCSYNLGQFVNSFHRMKKSVTVRPRESEKCLSSVKSSEFDKGSTPQDKDGIVKALESIELTDISNQMLFTPEVVSQIIFDKDESKFVNDFAESASKLLSVEAFCAETTQTASCSEKLCEDSKVTAFDEQKENVKIEETKINTIKTEAEWKLIEEVKFPEPNAIALKIEATRAENVKVEAPETQKPKLEELNIEDQGKKTQFAIEIPVMKPETIQIIQTYPKVPYYQSPSTLGTDLSLKLRNAPATIEVNTERDPSDIYNNGSSVLSGQACYVYKGLQAFLTPKCEILHMKSRNETPTILQGSPKLDQQSYTKIGNRSIGQIDRHKFGLASPQTDANPLGTNIYHQPVYLTHVFSRSQMSSPKMTTSTKTINLYSQAQPQQKVQFQPQIQQHIQEIPVQISEPMGPQALAKMNECIRFNEYYRSLQGRIPFSIVNLFTNAKHLRNEILGNHNVYFFYKTLLTDIKCTLDANASQKQVRLKEVEEKKLYLAKKRRTLTNKTLVFDMDETLIHYKEYGMDSVDALVPARYPDRDYQLRINLRPFVREMLKELSEFFEIIVFTASFSYYANPIIDFIDPTGTLIDHRLFRDNCIETENGTFIKDLRILGNRTLENIVLIDNSPSSFITHLENGVPVMPFFDNRQDVEMKYLSKLLMSLAHVPDVRVPLSRTFLLAYHNRYATATDWLNCLLEQM